ncbi:Thymidylate kinase [Streptococcus lutetiensis]|nr:Thymidylate kinase [Streptococcus lutetiensis]
MHKRVRQGYLALAQTEERIVTIDASRNLDQVVAEATQVILEQLS